jgi:hypothetical protein
MAQAEQDRPCIHVCLLGGVEDDLYRWVEVGAEEEGVPTRKVAVEANESLPAAYEAAQGSRFEIGVSVAPGRVTLHERHMPTALPVLSFDTGADPRPVCRLMGSNAARMVVHLPFRFGGEDDVPASLAKPHRRSAVQGPAQSAPATEPFTGLSDSDVKTMARVIARILRERGVL